MQATIAIVSKKTQNPLSENEAALDPVIERSQAWFLRQQQLSGFWQAPLEANVAMDAEYILFNRFLGREQPRLEARIADHILATQCADGGWALYEGGKSHLSNSIEAFFALKLTGRSGDEPELCRARDFIRAHGGLAKAGVFTRIFLSYFGQFPTAGLPAMPVELMLLPPWFPINIYALSSWARSTVVPLTVLMAKEPHVSIPPEQGVGELWLQPPTPQDLGFPRSAKWITWRNFFLALDQTLKVVGQSPWKPFRGRALQRAEEWIVSHQDWNGGWGGIQPAMINSVMALKVLGYSADHPAMAKGIRAIDEFISSDGDSVFFQPCVSPTWDTALASKALLDSGVSPDHPALQRSCDWLLKNQIFKPGDWQIYNPGLEPGGWAFEFANDWYPDVDDTAVILMTLKRIITKDPRAKDRAMAAGVNWVLGMQSGNGGWGAFDTNNDSEFLNEIPFADMEAMIDPPTEDLTGRLLELLGEIGFDLESTRVRRGRDFLLRTQRADGSWWGRWGSNFIYGTWSALSGLRSVGDSLRAPHVLRAVHWLKSHQNADGGWGESLESYADEACAGRGPSTPSQTAWAILGLLAGEDEVSPELRRGIDYLVRTQRQDGTWDESLFTGTGFPRHFYLRYDMYRNYFPLMALGRFRERVSSHTVH